MGYLPQFKNDLFLSYRRASNEGPDAWIDTFCNRVQSALRDRVGDVSIWRDTGELKAGDAWRPEIAEAVDTAGLFLAVISRTYFDSAECRKEFDRFLGSLKTAPDAGRKLVPIFKHPPKPDQELPRELAEIGHHEFYLREPKPWRELDPKLDSDYAPYNERLGRVVFDLMEAIETLHSLQKKQALGKVFVAAVPPELNDERERLRSDLRQRGFLVVPEREYLWNADDHRQAIAADLGDALLAVHMVSRTTSTEPLSAERSRLQLQLATAEMAQRGRPAPLVWIAPAERTDDSQKSLIDYIEQDLANQGVEYLNRSLEDLKLQIFDRLPRPAPKAQPKPREVALLVEDADAADLGPLKRLLVDKFRLEPRVLRFAGSTPKDPERLAKGLAACSQAILVWHRQPLEWVEDLLDLDALGEHTHPERLAVYAMGEASDDKADFMTGRATVIQAQVSLAEAELRGFADASAHATVGAV